MVVRKINLLSMIFMMMLVTSGCSNTTGFPTTVVSPAAPSSSMPAPTVIPTIEQTAALAVTPTQEFEIGSTQVSPRDGMVMVYVPAGEFLMGSPEGVGSKDEQPQHTVYLDAFWIDQTEITNDMFNAFVAATGYVTEAEKAGISAEIVGANRLHPQGPESDLTGREKHPTVHMSWYDAKTYCEWVGRRLPTEAEWEKAARGTDGRTYPWGEAKPDGTLADFADSNTDLYWADRTVNDGYKVTAPVDSYPAGASVYGALDMAGNAWEWVSDWYSESYYLTSPSINPTGPETGIGRVLKGGSWFSNASNIRSARRLMDDPALGFCNGSFRCVLSATP
jgi:formylglycine-generating enzyme required for sulfatase activity